MIDIGPGYEWPVGICHEIGLWELDYLDKQAALGFCIMSVAFAYIRKGLNSSKLLSKMPPLLTTNNHNSTYYLLHKFLNGNNLVRYY